MTGKIAVSIVGLVLANICLADQAKNSSAMFSDSQKLAGLTDDEFRTNWNSLSDDDRIKILREANANKAHPLRLKKTALQGVIAQTPSYVAGSESATLHRIYIGELAKLAVEVWNLKPESEKKDEAARFESIKAQIAAH